MVEDERMVREHGPCAFLTLEISALLSRKRVEPV
jgi:hypothetical protein